MNRRTFLRSIAGAAAIAAAPAPLRILDGGVIPSGAQQFFGVDHLCSVPASQTMLKIKGMANKGVSYNFYDLREPAEFIYPLMSAHFRRRYR